MKFQKFTAVLLPLVVIFVMLFTAACAPPAAEEPAEPAAPVETEAPAEPAAPAATEAPAAPAATEAPAEPAPVETIKIGAIYPMSGPMALNGQTMKAAHEFAAKEINDAGGIACLGGAKIEYVYGDHQGKPEAGNAETERLITKENVVLMQGAFDSGTTLTVTEISERYKVPFVVSSALATKIVERGFKYVFKTSPGMRELAANSLKFSLEQGAKTFVSLRPNLTWGELMDGYFTEAFDKQGVPAEDHLTIIYPGGASDFSDVVLQMKSFDADVVYMTCDTSDCILLTKNMQEADYYPKMGVVGPTTGSSDPEYLDNMGAEAMEGIIVANDWFPLLPGLKDVNERYMAANDGRNMAGGASTTYVATWLVKEVLEKACSTDREKIAEVLRTEKFESPQISMMYPYVKFDATGMNETTPIIMGQYKSGELVPVWPAEYKVGDLQWPVPSWNDR